MIQRAILMVLDSVGVGALPDAADYGDTGANTLGHVAEAVGGLTLPNLEALGLGHVGTFNGIRPTGHPDACFGRMGELAQGKDTTAGHWELAGQVLRSRFPTFPAGFPPTLIQSFEQAIGRTVLGNRPASGTEIIKELGEEHLRTGSPIVYTSADSVFQIAAHERITPVEELYQWCRTARKLLKSPHQVARVIARPFIGEPGAFIRTERRRDFSVEPPSPMLLDELRAAGQPVIGIGKIDDLFCGRGLTRAVHTGNNTEGIEATLRAIGAAPRGLIFVNLGDFDSLYGHRNDAPGYARALEALDDRVPEVLGALGARDMLIVTADHGNDPTIGHTDHTREFVPLLVYGPHLSRGVNLGTRKSFADVGQTIADALGAKRLASGVSFLNALMAA